MSRHERRIAGECLFLVRHPFVLVLTFPKLNGVLPIAYPNNINHAADYVCVLFIFIYTFGFSIGFGPAAWVYGSEVYIFHISDDE
jgi:hypothetical protein